MPPVATARTPISCTPGGRSARRASAAAAVLSGVWLLGATMSARAESVDFSAPDDIPATRIESNVSMSGKVLTSAAGGKTASHDLQATARFRLLERRLPPGGRDAEALRAVRQFDAAEMQAVVGGQASRVELPVEQRRIVSSGHAAGVHSYCPTAPLTRETLDLLEIPGDPLAVLGLFPPRPVDLEETWSPPEWAGQMLASIEAIEKSSLSCKLVRADDAAAVVEVSGSVKGQRHGADTEVAVGGEYTFDRTRKQLSAVRLQYTIKAAVGTVNTGADAVVDVQTACTEAPGPGPLTDDVVQAIPVLPADEQLALTFVAAPWGVTLRHHRDWHLFHAVLEGSPQVAILRLVDRGNLIAQCNMSPIAAAPAGQHTPLEQFEADIQKSLGARLGKITARENVDVGPGMQVFRVICEGEYTLTGDKGEVKIPTHWVYYLCAAPSGQQASFVFAVESSLLETLGNRDEVLVRSLEFASPRGTVKAVKQARPKK